ncbi:hypothetical protein MML48_2g00020421 [Holotrichia oblita]|uniref:Uncharacterized protein n=1 Tax=Holotrichia oblita TaxID=644536 RepID=A0ACB9TK36_HOLOL|nr:hypothetical protein MML48_2g00020421 [Holotrichia oblita]
MDDIYEQLIDDEDFVESIRIVENRRAPNRYMQRRDHFNIWTEQEFRQRYRLSKDTVRFVIHEISDEIANNTARNHSVSAEDMVLLTLRFLATGSFLRVAGDIHGIHESTASRIVTKVLYAIARKHNDPQEHLFNESQIRTRNPIERCFGIWMRRFPILSTGIKLNYDKVESIVLATAVLHNIARQRNEPEDSIDAVLQEHIEINVEVPPGAIRQNNVNNLIDYFQTLL